MFQCVPIHKFWETLGGQLAPQLGGRCINVRHYFLISGAVNAFTDFALLALVRNYVPAATWSAAEPSVAVVSACLPSLRPLFVRIVWGGNHRPKPPPSITHRSRS
ncbi:MAG: hypothetical protein Q9228_006308, partial [Teloschistes exilis]